jgi:hypothetical protein
MSSNQALATTDNLATLLYAMQQIVLADAQQNGNMPNPDRVYGKIVAAHWAAIRQSVGLAGKWATLDETKAALRAGLSGSGSGPAAPAVQGLSASMDFDMSEFDPASTMCTTCGTAGGRGPSGECLICGGI